MEIQSLSIDVPCTKTPCPNNCAFCVAKMRDEDYPTITYKADSSFDAFFSQAQHEFLKRMNFARDNGCNTLVLTGNGEPLYNHEYYMFVKECNSMLDKPFRKVEIQTTGVGVQKVFRIGKDISDGFISTASLSVADVFSDASNLSIMNTPKFLHFNLENICDLLKSRGLNLRLSLNLTDVYNIEDCGSAFEVFEYAKSIFKRCKELGADQITFRQMYTSGLNTDKDRWIKEHMVASELVREIEGYIRSAGRKLEVLPFGAIKYSVDGMGVVLDDDCMNERPSTVMKYLILRPNGKLYSRWDDEGSLIF